MRYFAVVFMFFLSACVGIPEGIEPVQDFEADRYLGQWYEIARLDHAFERGLEQVSADYSRRQDGGLNVINRGFDTQAKTWQQARGKAYFVGNSDLGHLKVSFFGPFYASYLIFDLGTDYQYSLVTSNNRSYLWLLSRTPKITDALKGDLLNKLANLGFKTQDLIFVKQTCAAGTGNKQDG
ncbi:lipocalin family protein [Thalassomonas haliotis]|uniref:Outer membrane lipoprotein Blc n=1 Tax=Thalassomonas haliotis TaxID=485448 RepID=A0ABY7VJ09_9GAMM|nr:lipocalin family protein [Thalassomonas haliotis]WDE13561.1 lipocalin family protein [Thalassomonas haliotis]